MDTQTVIDFLTRHLDTIGWLLALAATYNIGAARALAWFKSSPVADEVGKALDYGYAKVEEHMRKSGKPNDPKLLGLRFVRDFYHLLGKAVPDDIAHRAEIEWTIRHQAENRIAAGTPPPPPV